MKIDLRKAEEEAKLREMANKREQFREKNNENDRPHPYKRETRGRI